MGKMLPNRDVKLQFKPEKVKALLQIKTPIYEYLAARGWVEAVGTKWKGTALSSGLNAVYTLHPSGRDGLKWMDVRVRITTPGLFILAEELGKGDELENMDGKKFRSYADMR